MTGLIICCVVLAIVVIYLAIELYFQAKKVTDLTDQNIRLYEEIVRQPTYRIVNKLIFVDFCNLPTTEEQIKQAAREAATIVTDIAENGNKYCTIICSICITYLTQC